MERHFFPGSLGAGQRELLSHVRIAEPKKRNRENNREFFESDRESLEFCPKSAKLAYKQGINREFCGYLPQPACLLGFMASRRGCKKLTGNYQGIFLCLR
jgi:hypothetical protein